MQGITSLGWECLTEVQRDTIPLARQGRDVIGQARTGSGKTAAFGIPILERCQPTGSLQGMVLAPTRELAQQVAEEMTLLQGDQGLSIMTVYGGTDLEKQARGLESGIDVIVGTPGRVMDMSERGHLDLSKIEIFCLDEADRMLDMGFLPDILWILERTTSREQTLLFSATFPQEILDAANEFTNNPEFVMTNQEELDVPQSISTGFQLAEQTSFGPLDVCWLGWATTTNASSFATQSEWSTLLFSGCKNIGSTLLVYMAILNKTNAAYPRQIPRRKCPNHCCNRCCSTRY